MGLAEGSPTSQHGETRARVFQLPDSRNKGRIILKLCLNSFVLLQKYIVTGGYGSETLDSTEIFDPSPSPGTWTAGAPLPVPLYLSRGVNVDNRVLIFGKHSLSLLIIAMSGTFHLILFAPMGGSQNMDF